MVINLSPSETGAGLRIRRQDRRWCDSPKEYIGSVEQGIKEALDNGILAGFPIIDVRVELVDGSYHDVDSNEMAFKIAGSMAFKEAVRRREPVRCCSSPSWT